MKMPNPKATTTTEAYLAYKAGVIAEAELKPKLYHPYIHLDGWLAYWCGLVDTYPTDKNGDPECLTDEEAYIAYLANVTNAYPLNLKDPADPRVAGYLRYLIAAKFGRPNYPVTREEFYLSIMKPPVVGNLTPASSIELDGVITSPFISLEAYGDTSQQTYTGKNLFDLRKWHDNAKRNNVTNTEMNSEGGFWFTSNAGADAFLGWTYNSGTITNSQDRACLFPVKPSTNYTISCKGATLGNSSYVCFADSSYNVLNTSYIGLSNGYSASFTTPANTAYILLRLGNLSSSAQRYEYKYIQLEEGRDATSYEPYVGGVASPNPNYPQEVKTVTGRQVVGTRSKNLVGVFPKTGGDNGITATYDPDTGWIELEGTATESWSNCFDVQLANFDHTKTYVMSAEGDDDFQRNISFFSDESYTTQVGDNRMMVGENSHTVSISGDAVAIRLWLGGVGNKNLNGKRFRIQLEEANTPTDFVPYGKDYEINLGKNLATTNSGTNNFNIGEIKKGETYTLSFDLLGDIASGGAINLKYGSGGATIYAFYNPQKGHKTVTFTASDTANLYYNAYGGGSASGADNIQLEKGTEETSYAPYFEPIELCKIGDFQDYIYRDLAGNWKIHKEIYKYVMTGEENLVLFNSGKNARMGCSDADPTGGVYNNIPVAYSMEDGSICPVRCNMLQPTTSGGGWNGTPNSISLGEVGSPAYGCITFAIPNVSTVATYLYRLRGAEIYYALKEATEEELTNEELIAQLDALMEGGSYEGTTYITVSSEDLPALLKVEAAKDV